MKKLRIGNLELGSRLFVGSGKFGNYDIMREALIASKSELITVALKRVDIKNKEDDLLEKLKVPNSTLLPNTSGVRSAKEAIFSAQLIREALETNIIKLEIHPDQRYLLPDPVETLKASKELVKEGFIVLPYINADPVLCKKLEDVGVAAVMPLGSPIGSNKGLKTLSMLEIIIKESKVPVVIDAGIGAPSHAAQAMEMGADAVLINTAIAVSQNPVKMAKAFKKAVEAGLMAFEAKTGEEKEFAQPSSPMTTFFKD